MIASFDNEGTEDIWNGDDTKAARKTLDRTLWDIAHRKLDLLNAAHDVMDLRAPPGNRLEKLKGDFAGRYSIRINQQLRIVFSFANGNATDVTIVDYH